jgi:DNA polymerase I-like protein with 3'-5' exonuclease and polymerase domains
MKHISLDIETECDVSGCVDTQCKHALDFNRNRITVVGLYGEGIKEVHRDLVGLSARIESLGPVVLVGHNIISFDLKTLKAKGVDLTHYPVEDTQLMAVAAVEKIPQEWLEGYERKRKEINKALPHGHKGHREAGQHSLKTLAPYFLRVPAFWEATDGHDNDEYVLRDCEYTLKLFRHFSATLASEGTEKFYREKLIPWAWMIFEGEWQGVSLDFNKIATKEKEATERAAKAKAELDRLWADAYETYGSLKADELRAEYEQMSDAAIARMKAPTADKINRTRARYTDLRYKAEGRLEPLNLDSPAQMAWLLRDHLGYDITDYEGDETTGIEVLERLAAEGKEDIKRLIEYRESQKLCTSFFPSYREFAFNGTIHCNVSLSTTRTGRTASQRPNLQQQPSHIRDIFVSRPEFSFITRDYSGIEPVLAGYYTQDPILCDLLIRGGNFHSANTPSFFPYVDCPEDQVKKLFPMERDAAKELGLMLAYGGGWRRVKISCMKRGFRFSDRECKDRYDAFTDRYQTMFEFKQKTLDPMLKAGEVVTNLLGRKFSLPPDDVHMKGFNRMVQSSASDLLLQSSRKIAAALNANGIDGIPLLWVHDELVLEVEDGRLSEAAKIVDSIMTDYKLPTPYGNLPLHVEGNEAKFWSK